MTEPDSDTQTKYKASNPTAFQSSPNLLLRFRRPLIVLAHIVVFTGSLMLSFLVTSNMQFNPRWLTGQYPVLLVFFVAVKIVIFGLFKQYRGWWRYVGISDLTGIIRASLVSTLIIVVIWFSGLQIDPVRKTLPAAILEVGQGVFMADLLGTIFLLAGLRMAIRLYHEEFRTVEVGRLKRFLIVGAGNTGEALLREIHRMRVAEYEVVGFIDDDPSKQGIRIHDIPVLGTVEQLPEICKNKSIEEVAIAMPSATVPQRRRVVQVCQGTKVRFRTVPSMTDIASGRFRVSQIRDVDINDLLGRETVQLDTDLIEAFIKGKTILVTGAGGSIGSEMCRQICYYKPKLLLLVEQAENPLFYIEREIRERFPDILVSAVVCDITDRIRVDAIFDKYRPEVVIHAAAHKHVPLMELNPGEAIKNNVVGSRTVADAADKNGCGNFVMISTDKAVNPTSIMGSSKRVAEMYVQDLNRTSKTHFVTVRFGNVLDSEGSVVPIFRKQIAQGGPVTVTHPEMKRYFMTIPEASQLVLQAASMGKGGEIFLLDMGEPVKIVDLARELITLSGFRPGEDIEIAFTGLRPGEKLFEELSIKGEDMQETRHPKIGIWKNIPMDRDKLRQGIAQLVALAGTGEHGAIVAKIKELVPEYAGGNNHHTPQA
jgi:FlaA1/EpsC-like NDP-sugar epimerase